MAFRVLMTARAFRDQPGEHKRILEEAGCELIPSPQDRPLTPAELIPLVANVDAVIAGVDPFNADVIAAAKGRLRVISRFGVGIDTVDLTAATCAGIVVTNTPGANHIAVAELALGLMLALARRIPQHDRIVKSGSWKRTVGIELAEKTLGIVGLGRVGEGVARRARAFDMRIVYYDVQRRPDLEAEGWVAYVGLDKLLQQADIVSLHCAYSPQAGAVIGSTQLRAMKAGAFLVNTARGELVDEGALVQALQEGWIAGAATDVFVHEPPSGSPLLALDNLIATPHAGAATHEAVRRMGNMAARNAVLVLQGQRPLAVANPQIYEEKLAS